VFEMDADEPEHAAESSKREPKPTAKAVALEIETLQKDRKAKVNQMKHMILSMKDLLKCDGNAPKVRSFRLLLKQFHHLKTCIFQVNIRTMRQTITMWRIRYNQQTVLLM